MEVLATRVRETAAVTAGYAWIVFFSILPLAMGGASTIALALHALVMLFRMALGIERPGEPIEPEIEELEPELPANVIAFPGVRRIAPEPAIELERAA